jgi:uncharacterized SAM-binding protein YcdF (DUF218 family)
MSWSDVGWMKSLLLPPGSPLLALVAGLLVRGRLGRALAVASALALITLSLPLTARALSDWLEARIPAAAADPAAAQAIVVLAGDYRVFAPEYGEASVGGMTLVRLHHAAYLQRRTGLPLLVSGGGTPPEFKPDLAGTMRLALERDFGVPVRWTEARSRNTLENAAETHRILAAAGIDTVQLVTHAHHMPRSVQAFAAMGLKVIPAPAGGQGPWLAMRWGDLLPDSRALDRSCASLHEILGMLWYDLVLHWRGTVAS